MTNHRKKRRRRSVLERFRGYSVGIAVVAAVGGLFTLNSCTSPDGMTTTVAVSPVPADIDFTGRVSRIVDGDTFWVNSQNVSIRIWGLDAPEIDQPGGSAATGELASLILNKTSSVGSATSIVMAGSSASASWRTVATTLPR